MIYLLRPTSSCVLRRMVYPSRAAKVSSDKLDYYNQIRYAGHAKWQNIKNTKQAGDLAKGKMTSRYVLMVRRAILSNNMQADPKLNTQLGNILSEASKLNIAKATLERAITRALNIQVKSVMLEIEGPSKSTLVVRCETDNIPNLRREVKKVLKKFDANLLPDDTVINMFKSQGFLRTELKTTDQRDITEDFAEEAAIMVNAQEVYLEDDITNDGEKPTQSWVFVTDSQTLNPCKGELEKLNFIVKSTDLDLVPYRAIDFGGDVYEKIVDLTRALQDVDGVLDIFHNVEPPKE